LAAFCVDIQRVLQEFAIKETNLAGFDLPDPIAMAVALKPEVKELSKRLFVTIETQSQFCRGQALVDHMGVTGEPPNVEVVLAASRERFLEQLYEAVREG
jgi:purine nucleosidase